MFQLTVSLIVQNHNSDVLALKMELSLKKEELLRMEGKLVELREQTQILLLSRCEEKIKIMESEKKFKEKQQEIDALILEMENTKEPILNGTSGPEKLGLIIYAVNAAGNAIVDSNGISYIKDPYVGLAAGTGHFAEGPIGRVSPQDYPLFQSCRWGPNANFVYDIPLGTTTNGEYVLVLRFIEHTVKSAKARVFDVSLNTKHTILKNLDVYEKVKYGVVHDEHIPFVIKDKTLIYNNSQSTIVGDKINLDFIFTGHGGPMISAMYLMKGTLKNVPKLPPL